MGYFDGASEEQIKKSIKTALTLEYLGISIENSEEIDGKAVYFFSVPETSTIETKTQDAEKVKTADGLIAIAKETLTETFLDMCKDEFGDDKEFIKEIKEEIDDYVKFYAKVRTGEVWTKEMGDNSVKKITEELKAVSGYKEV